MHRIGCGALTFPLRTNAELAARSPQSLRETSRKVSPISAIRREDPRARIIVLTTAAGDVQAVSAFKAGAVGYLLKNLLRTELIETIRLVYSGSKRIPPEIAQQIAEHAGDDDITARELDVLRGIAKGHSNKIIASSLNISEHTVKNHLKNILSKVDASDRTHAVMIALKHGFLDMFADIGSRWTDQPHSNSIGRT